MTTETEIPAQLVHSGIDFLREITHHYGDEQGMALWRSMSDGMGKDIQNAIILNMLRGDAGGVVTVSAVVPDDQQKFIEGIKWVRHVTNFGLKDAKDFMDKVRWGPQKLKLSPGVKVRDFAHAMGNAGYKVL